MGMNSINDLEYFNSLDNSDTDDNFEQFEPVLSRAEEALIKAKKSELTRSDRRANFHMNRERPEENKFTVQGVASTVADFTPVVGEIKAASELPNDLSYDFELVESGYDEGDLKKMGLGGAFAVLSTMGIVPGVRIGAKAGKEAIKGRIKLTDEEVAEFEKALEKGTTPKKEMPPEFAKQLKKLDEEMQKQKKSKPKPDIFGLTPEAVDNLVDDLAMLGKSQNQIVTNKQLKELV